MIIGKIDSVKESLFSSAYLRVTVDCTLSYIELLLGWNKNILGFYLNYLISN